MVQKDLRHLKTTFLNGQKLSNFVTSASAVARVKKRGFFLNQPGGFFGLYWVFRVFFFNVQCEKNLAEK